ncbi:bacterial Ig-like domain-containing protein [Enterococcus faecalis]|uniref:bacterial Ig-like domain-containing protein n=1 Tax=Enterococcus faecalis TaxID=1351 RepID=UPI0035EB5AE8
MRKKFILLLFALMFFIKQEEVVYSETETVSSQAEIIEPYGLYMQLIDPYYIEAGANFNYRLPILEAKDENGYPISHSNISYAWRGKAIDTSKQGDSAIAEYFRIDEPFIRYSTTVKVAYNLVLETKNTILYEGQVWNPENNLVKAYDEDSNPVYYQDDRIKNSSVGPTDTSKPGLYQFVYTLVGKLRSISSSFYVTVKEDKTKAELKDTELYVGQKWDLRSVFKNVVDKDGNPIKPEEVNHVWIDGNKTREIDTSKPGKHGVKIAILKANNEWVYSNDVAVTVKEDKTKAELKDTELYVGQKWDLRSVFKNVVDKDGNPIKPEEVNYVWIDGNKTREIDTSKPGKHGVKIAILKANNEWVYSNDVTVTVEDKTSIKTKNSTIYVGQGWGQIDNFVSATDEVGQNVPFQDNRIRMEGATDVEPRKPGVYKVTYIFDGKFKQVKSESTVTVKEDKTKAELKDTELYVGQKWDLRSVFKNVVDKDGNPIKPEEVNYVWIDGNKTREIDTSKPGKHGVKIAILKANNEWVYSNNVAVTVKEDKTKAELKDTELYVGQKWDLRSVFKNVVDKDGNPIKPEEVNYVWIDGDKTREIDTSRPGKHGVKIAILKANNEWVYSNDVTVTVKEEPFTLKHVSDFDFGEKELTSINRLVTNNKENPIIELETPSIIAKDWQLQVELSPFLDKKNSKSILKGVSLFIPKGKLESDLETEEPIQYDCQLEANGKASILMQGTKTKGKGRWKNKLATKEITLSIPPENKKGSYESTLHWTLLDVPG